MIDTHAHTLPIAQLVAVAYWRQVIQWSADDCEENLSSLGAGEYCSICDRASKGACDGRMGHLGSIFVVGKNDIVLEE